MQVRRRFKKQSIKHGPVTLLQGRIASEVQPEPDRFRSHVHNTWPLQVRMQVKSSMLAPADSNLWHVRQTDRRPSTRCAAPVCMRLLEVGSWIHRRPKMTGTLAYAYVLAGI